MKERPILFSRPMVKALLAGTKTQTRRVMKNADYLGCPTGDCPHETQILCDHAMSKLCPNGQVSDRLWVRETHSRIIGTVADSKKPFQYVVFPVDGSHKYSTGEYYPGLGEGKYNAGAFDHIKWRPSIFMPRWASRITLEITAIRFERLNDISEQDAEAEGVERNRGAAPWKINDGWFKYPLEEHIEGFPAFTARQSYQTLWESINGADSWKANPWVWVIEFKRVAPVTSNTESRISTVNASTQKPENTQK